ncbi:hypothetical protein OZX57_06540 [Bifidobacterium sp. ESL0682]|uniref:hypothetical protein n=1 Tax=Bifidobacterium sp. ESL0682 TaxID=2983212 RepID=UPI0023F975FD|nr:hypothetical protein [Bifidobacterium sp. ESL0682]WEV41644.1 hypothetical protein OZX57_06540 [Bifidobacterium sp. ESL0682]
MSSGNDPLRWIVERLNSMQKQLDEASRPKRTQTYASVDKIREQDQHFTDLQKKVDAIVEQNSGVPVYVVSSLPASSPSVPCVLLVADTSSVRAWFDDGKSRRAVSPGVTRVSAGIFDFARMGDLATVSVGRNPVGLALPARTTTVYTQRIPEGFRPHSRVSGALAGADDAGALGYYELLPDGGIAITPSSAVAASRTVVVASIAYETA